MRIMATIGLLAAALTPALVAQSSPAQWSEIPIPIATPDTQGPNYLSDKNC